MYKLGRCPFATEVFAELTDREMSYGTVSHHMNALAGASGLPYPIRSGGERQTSMTQTFNRTQPQYHTRELDLEPPERGGILEDCFA